CGDALCNGSESPTNCPSDCGSVAGGGGYCGDGTCQAARGETSTMCPGDCGQQSRLPSTITLPITAQTCGNTSIEGGSRSWTVSNETSTAFTLTSTYGQQTRTSSGTKLGSNYSVTSTNSNFGFLDCTSTQVSSWTWSGSIPASASLSQIYSPNSPRGTGCDAVYGIGQNTCSQTTAVTVSTP
ncbi:MAG: hypothetical protein HYT77_09345, partial [Deltaproteobacteria bacterium]|nr:hypothetical protein [Deltaproteobacteria bacterium]